LENRIPVYQDYPDYDMDGDEFAEPEFYVDQFYPPQDEFEDEDDGGGLAPFSLSEILEHCIEPTVTDGFKHMSKILVWSLIFRLSTQMFNIPTWTKHAASIVTGTILASNFFSESVFFLLVLITLSYPVLVLLSSSRGPVLAALVISFNIGCEKLLAEPVSWHMVRGAIMICSMKIISIGFDLDEVQRNKESNPENFAEKKPEPNPAPSDKRSKERNGVKSRTEKRNGTKTEPEIASKDETVAELTSPPGWFEFAGYCLCPGTVVLGPWIPFHEYQNIFINPRWNLNWFVKILFTVSFSFMFLTISTCWNPWLIPDSGWKWWLAYRDAMSFRASHYFVSFMSEASAIAAGFGATKTGLSTQWQVQVTQPHNIEVPRSLVEVVVSWNIPMHAWLKKYVFKPTRKSLGSGVAVFATYGASTLLHGLSAQLGAVLFSLGLYTWVEHSFRGKLAKIMNASIETRRDTENKYKHREGATWVMFVNLLFGLLTMFHLAYLGVMFSQTEESVTGYSWAHTLNKWKNLDFISHYIVGGILLVNWVL
jgi:hypothetical protein